MQTIKVFETAEAALADRRTVFPGGGWVFVDHETGEAILFPFGMTPTPIMLHPITKGRSGKLI